MEILLIVGRMAMLLAMLGAGFVVNRLGILNLESNKTISAIILNISLPCLTFSAMIRPLEKELVTMAAYITVIAFAIHLAMAGLSFLYVKFLKLQPQEAGPHQFSLVFGNVGFVGFPIVTAFFDSTMFFAAVIWNAVFWILLFPLGQWLLDKNSKFQWSSIYKCPTLIALAIGIVFFLRSIGVPEFIYSNISLVGNMTTPLSMIFVGNALASANMKGIFKNKALWITTATRLLVIPILSFLVLRIFTRDYYLVATPVLLGSLPVAATLSIFAQKYDADVALSSQLIFLTTLVGMATIPVFIYLLQTYTFA